MQAAPTPDALETRDNLTFEAVLWALSRPGEPRALPDAGAGAILSALVDRECRAYADDPEIETLLRQSGASLVPLELADHVFAGLTTDSDLARFMRVPVGDMLYPDQGATVIAPAQIGSGTALRLTGPGIETARDIRLGGLHPRLWEVRATLCRYPLGVEMLFVDGAQILALPRSTQVEGI